MSSIIISGLSPGCVLICSLCAIISNRSSRPSSYKVYLGLHEERALETSVQKRDVEKLFKEPHRADIALLKLRRYLFTCSILTGKFWCACFLTKQWCYGSVCFYAYCETLSSLSAEAPVEAKVIQLQDFRKGKSRFGEGGGLEMVTYASSALRASCCEVRWRQQRRRRLCLKKLSLHNFPYTLQS